MKEYNCLIVTGTDDETKFKENILYLKCNDHYEGLPEKVIKMYKYIFENIEFDNYSHIIKLDSDMNILRKIPHDIFRDLDYGGITGATAGNRQWHIGRCSPSSKFNTQPYTGEYVPWCKGGYGYILSRRVLSILSEHATDYFNEIYEDLYVAKVLLKYGIKPVNILAFKSYVKSPNH